MQIRLTVTLAGLALCVTGRARAEMWAPDDLRGPRPELVRAAPPVALPHRPVFERAPTHAGYHTPLELRQRGDDLLDHELLVKGFVTGIYDCVADLAARFPGSSRDQLLFAIDKDISICERPKFYLGQLEAVPPELSITVVNVPRPPIHRERIRMNEVDFLRWPKVPRIALRDYLGVTGTWARVSPSGERDRNGLLVYHSLVHEPVTAEARDAGEVMTTVEPEVVVDTRVPLRRVIGNERWNLSIDHLNACTRAVSARRFDAALPECERATQIWADNHLAWYGIASAQLALRAWASAIAPAARAVQLRPDQAMYQLYYGIALYETAHGDPAHHPSVLPSWIQIPTYNDQSVRLDQARDAFRRAIKLMPGLWRARYYLARIEIEHGESALAASQLDQAIVLNPGYAQSYVSLAELYLRGGYRTQARAVAQAGVQRVAAGDAGDLWYELGSIHEADRARPEAIEAYAKVLAGDPNHIKARLARGRLLVDIGNRGEAVYDLNVVAATRDPALVVERQLARQLLWKITH